MQLRKTPEPPELKPLPQGLQLNNHDFMIEIGEQD